MRLIEDEEGKLVEEPERSQTEEEIAQSMIRWKPYLAYVDGLISRALIQAASTRYQVLIIHVVRLREIDARCL